MSSSRVKIQKLEIWENDLPAVCMVCGENPGQTKHDTNAVYTFFPLSMLGLLGTMISPKKIPFPIVCCNDCKPGYNNEHNMTQLFGFMYTLCFLSLGYPIATNNFPGGLMVPVVAYASTLLLHTVYYWSIGRKYAIRCVGMDHGTVSMEFPGGRWGVAYTLFRRDKADRRLGRTPRAAAPAASGAADAAPIATAAATVDPAVSPPVQELKTGGGGIPMEGDTVARIPNDLTEFLSAVKEGDVDKVETLIGSGADIKEALPNGMNALHISCIAGLMQLADLLIRRGLDVNSAMANGLTPMHLAVQSNNQSMVGLLLAKKGDPNRPNEEGRTPLHWCAAVQDSRLDPTNRFKMANVLLKGGGDITLQDKDGNTPAQLAKEGGEEKVAEVFTA